MSLFTLPTGVPWNDSLRENLGACSDPVWLYDPDAWRVVWANAAGVRFWRAESLEALQQRDFEAGISDHARSRLAEHRRNLEAGQISLDRWTFFPDEGAATNVDILMAPLQVDGRMHMLKRARVLDAVDSATTSRGVEALQHTDVLVTMCTLEGRLLFENPAAQRVYGFSTRPPEDALSARFSDAADAAHARGQVSRGVAFHREVEVRTTGATRWHDLDVHVSKDPVTAAPCLIITERDISVRRQHELELEKQKRELTRSIDARTEELALERDQFEQVFDTVSALVLLVDQTGTILRANAWAHAVLHRAELLGQKAFDICGFPQPEVLAEWVAANQAPADAVEVVLRPGPDRSLHILWTPRVSRGPDGRSRLVLTGLDITQLRSVETRLQITDRMATIGALAAGVAHDLNNPLAFVTTNAEMLIEELDRAGVHGDLRLMARDCLEGARRAAVIVSQLRTFARGSASGAAGVAHVHSVVEFAARMAKNHVKHHAQIFVDCPGSLYASIDESKLGQVMLNLIVHAADTMEPGEASRHQIRIVADTADPGWMCLRVEDDGGGLSSTELRRIFDPYSSPHTPPRGMTGLGLAISHRLITEAGGRVEVNSREGEGTSVQVWLRSPPKKESGDYGPTPRPPSSSPYNQPLEAPEASEPRILLVDDEVKLRAVVKRVLRAHAVDEANDGREALEALAKRRYDVVLCDVMMPEMTGMELYETVREQNPEQAERFVFLSGGAFTPDTARFLESTSRTVLDKPFSMSQLRKIVERAMADAAG